MSKEEFKKELDRALRWSSIKQDKLFKSNFITRILYNKALKFSWKM